MTVTSELALLLVAHGSHRSEANRDLYLLADHIRERRSDVIVEVAFLEIAKPTIPEGFEACLKQASISAVRMVPYFLSAGNHVAQDLVRYQQEFSRSHPSVRCSLSPPIGTHPLLAEIILERAAQEWNTPQEDFGKDEEGISLSESE